MVIDASLINKLNPPATPIPKPEPTHERYISSCFVSIATSDTKPDVLAYSLFSDAGYPIAKLASGASVSIFVKRFFLKRR